MTKTYQKAFTEVYEILNYLDEESYNKIPKDIIKAIKENRNIEYTYFLDESIPFSEQKMLIETKAILFNLYRDYLTTPKRKQKIIDYQNEEIKILEKRKKYNPEELFINRQQKITRDNNLPVEVKKESFFKKLVSFIKNKILY